MQEGKGAGKKLAGRKYHHGEDTDRAAEGERLGDGECSEAFLCRVTGEENLSAVRNLTLTIDTNVTQVDHLGILMPRLTELRLERGSTLASFRDLGSSLANLRVLWLSACGIRHVDGVGALAALEELYLAFNDVDDLTSIALHDRLEVLDLESNNVEEAEQAMHLGTCPCLWSLTLASNPLCRNRHYRREVVDAVPQLALLDEEDVNDSDRCSPPLPGEEPSDELLAESTPAPSPCKISQKGPKQCPGITTEIRYEHPALKSKTRPTGLTASSSDAQLLRRDGACATSRGCGTCPRELHGVRTDPTEAEEARNRRRQRGKRYNAGTDRGQPLSWLAESCSAGNLRGPAAGQAPLRLLENDACGSGQDADTRLYVVTADVTHEPKKRSDACEGRRSTGAIRSASRVASRKAVSRGAGSELECAGGGRKEEEWLARGKTKVDTNAVECEQQMEHRGGAPAVDEEQLVAEAVKTFRLSSKSKAMHWFTDNEREPFTGGDECTTNFDDGQKFGVLPLLAAIQGTGSAHTAVGRLDEEEGSSGAGNRRSEEMEGRALEENDWLLKMLRLQDIPFEGCGRWASPGRNTASSTLTHGSEVSIAGNPAFGLRRRRTPEENADRATISPRPPSNFEQEITASSDMASRGITNLQRPAKTNAGLESSASTRTGTHACGEHETIWSIGGGTRCCRGTGGGEEIGRSDSQRPLSAGEAATDAREGPTHGSPRSRSYRACVVSHNNCSGREEPEQEASLFCRALLSPPLRQRRGNEPRANSAGCILDVAPGLAYPVGGTGLSGKPTALGKLQVPLFIGRRNRDVSTALGGGSETTGTNRAISCHAETSAKREVWKSLSEDVVEGPASVAATTATTSNVSMERSRRAAKEGAECTHCDSSGKGAKCESRAGAVCDESDGSGGRGATRCCYRGMGQDRRVRGAAAGPVSPKSDRCTVADGQESDCEVPESSPATTVSGGGGDGDCVTGGGCCCSRDVYDSGTGRESVDGERHTRGGGYRGKRYATGPGSLTTRTNRENSSGRRASELDRSTETTVREMPVAATPWLADPASNVGTRSRRQRGDQRGSWSAVHNQPVEPTSQRAGGTGSSDRRLSEVSDGELKDDDTLVALLRERRKNVPQIRTREAFCDFFRGMGQERLGRLLRTAYVDCGPAECDAKVKKRLMLMERSWAPLPKDASPG